MALLEGVTWQGKVLKDGEWTDGRGGTYAVIEPATGNELGTMGQADAEDVAEAAASAAQAQKEWAALPHTARAAVLRRAGDLWAEHADEIRDWNVREVGAIPPMADFAMHVASEECYQAAALPGQPIGQVLPSEQPRLSMARQLPAGVVAVISPFNVPIILGIRSVAPALALGNAVLLKPASWSPLVSLELARIVEEAGLPKGLFSVLPGAGREIGNLLVEHPDILRATHTNGSGPLALLEQRQAIQLGELHRTIHQGGIQAASEQAIEQFATGRGLHPQVHRRPGAVVAHQHRRQAGRRCRARAGD